MTITIPKKAIQAIQDDDVVLIPRTEYERLCASQVPTVFLKGKAARRLDARVSAAQRWYARYGPVEAGIAEGLEDIRHGRVYGPFTHAPEMIASLKRNLAKRAAKRTPRK